MEHAQPEPQGHALSTQPLLGAEPSGLVGCFADASLAGVPLTYGQRRFWSLAQDSSERTSHHLVLRLRVDGPLDVLSLEWALSSIVSRHEGLRATFAEENGDVVQTVSRHYVFRLARADLGDLDNATRNHELDAITREEATRPFDLGNDLLLRARLVRLGEDRHVILVVVHPIGADTGSLPLFLKELGELYAAFCARGISLLPEPTLQYADHACWQRMHLRGETLRRMTNFWRERLADAPPLLALPTDRPRPAVQSQRAATCATLLPRRAFEQVQAFSRAQRVTPFMTMLAAFKTLLFRYTGHDDIVVGSPLRGRVRPETKELIGVFENTLVLRTRLGGNPTFFELLERVRETTLAAREHQELPFEKLVEELQPAHNPSYAPICQVFFSIAEKPATLSRLGTLPASVELLPSERTTADLSVIAQVEPAGLRLRAEYASDLFDAGTIEQMLGHFATLLETVTTTPERGIGFLPMLTPQGKSLLLSNWNATTVEYPKNTYIHTLFERQAARTPEATALVFNDRELTYAELDRRADAMAARLRARGAGPETVVALCAERSLDMMIGLLGILKAGAAYLPLDPAFPADRLAFMLEDSQATVLVTQSRLRSVFADRVSVVCIDDEGADTALNDHSLAKIANPSSEHLAYVLYTSGSTGRPKGVMVSHRNVVNFFTGMDPLVGATPGVWLAVTSISFDISVLELFWTLTRGYKVVILADQAGFKTAGEQRPAAETIRSIDEQIARHGVTHLQCTPSFARLLTQLPDTLAALRPLRRLLVGGEALPADLAVSLSEAIDGELINMYGPTETTVWSTAHRVKTRDLRAGTVEIGRPIANTQVYILDAHRQPVPTGVYGEVYIGGDGVARGYWNRPELTDERFVRNAFSHDPDARLYRTGDLARYRADGVIEFLGRADHQVKVRGHRIELGEIEAVLALHSGVRQSVVVVRTDHTDAGQIVAYVVADPTVGDQHPDALTDYLRGKLPEHMVPEAFVFMEALPLTPNGKIDRNALPAPVKKTAPAASASSVPADNTTSLSDREQVIAGIWKDILGVEAPGANDNFFDLGGRSLQIVQVKNRLHEALGRDLPVTTLFQYPTIRSLADFLGAETAGETADDDFLTKIHARTQRRQKAMAGR